MTESRGRMLRGAKQSRLRSRQNVDARTPVRRHLNRQLRLENLFKQVALINGGRRPDAQALAFLQQHNLVSIFANKVDFMRDNHHRVAVLRRKAAEDAVPVWRFLRCRLVSNPQFSKPCRLKFTLSETSNHTRASR